MDTQELIGSLEAGDLKRILKTEGPCLSIYAPLPESPAAQGQYALRWKEMVRDLERAQTGKNAGTQELVHSVANWDEVYQPQEAHGQSIAIFRSAEFFARMWLDARVEARAVVAPHFFIRPLLTLLSRDPIFYILALSQKDIRLLRCAANDCTQVELRNASTSFDGYMDTAKPDHTRDNRSAAGPSAGHSKGVLFGTDSSSEDKQEYLAHFYKEIDHSVVDALKDSKAPLVLAGVDYELSIYRGLSAYLHLLPQSVHGAPNSLKGGELHQRALEALDQDYTARIDDFLTQYNHKSGGLAIHGIKDVVLAANDGRVHVLLVSDSLESTGRFEENLHQVKVREDGSPQEEDLLNDAAVQTILHGGQVLVASNPQMPNGAAMAALLRF
jgi:hypothetical protein